MHQLILNVQPCDKLIVEVVCYMAGLLCLYTSYHVPGEEKSNIYEELNKNVRAEHKTFEFVESEIKYFHS